MYVYVYVYVMYPLPPRPVLVSVRLASTPQARFVGSLVCVLFILILIAFSLPCFFLFFFVSSSLFLLVSSSLFEGCRLFVKFKIWFGRGFFFICRSARDERGDRPGTPEWKWKWKWNPSFSFFFSVRSREREGKGRKGKEGRESEEGEEAEFWLMRWCGALPLVVRRGRTEKEREDVKWKWK